MPMLTHHGLGFEKPQKLIDLSLDDDVPQPEPDPVEIDPFIDEIFKVKSSQSPAVKETIERADCFGRYWYDDSSGICTELDCDLRSLCELTYTRSAGKIPEKPIEPVSPLTSQQIPSQKSKKSWNPALKKFPSSRAWVRSPYVNLGRLSDELAEEIWIMLGYPPSLPDVWAYPSTTTKSDERVAHQQFIDRYGSGVLVSKKQRYHQYFKDGVHFLRIWMVLSKGCWIDISKEVCQAAIKVAPRLRIELPPSALIKKRYRFYPNRIYSRKEDLKHWAKIFLHLNVYPLGNIDDSGTK